MEIGEPLPSLFVERSQFSDIYGDASPPRGHPERSTSSLIRLSLAQLSHAVDPGSPCQVLKNMPPPAPRAHSDLHPDDYARMSLLMQRMHASSQEIVSREASYVSPASSRASSTMLSPHSAGHIGANISPTVETGLRAQLAKLRAKKPPISPNSSHTDKRRVASYTNGNDEGGKLHHEDTHALFSREHFFSHASQTNMKVSMRRQSLLTEAMRRQNASEAISPPTAYTRRASQLPSDDEGILEVEEDERPSRQVRDRHHHSSQSALCLGPRLSNSRSVQLMMRMGLLGGDSNTNQRERKALKGHHLPPLDPASPPLNMLPIGAQKMRVPGQIISEDGSSK